MTEAMQGLAQSIAKEPGLVWKIWTLNKSTNEAGGIYLFKEMASAKAYLSMHTERLKKVGILFVNGKVFAVNGALTKINRGPIHEI